VGGNDYGRYDAADRGDCGRDNYPRARILRFLGLVLAHIRMVLLSKAARMRSRAQLVNTGSLVGKSCEAGLGQVLSMRGSGYFRTPSRRNLARKSHTDSGHGCVWLSRTISWWVGRLAESHVYESSPHGVDALICREESARRWAARVHRTDCSELSVRDPAITDGVLIVGRDGGVVNPGAQLLSAIGSTVTGREGRSRVHGRDIRGRSGEHGCAGVRRFGRGVA